MGSTRGRQHHGIAVSIACLPALAVAVTGCASARKATPPRVLPHPAVASLESVPPRPASPTASTASAGDPTAPSPDAAPFGLPAPPDPPEPPDAPDAEVDLSAAALLERGFAFFQEEKLTLAADAFRGAISTGNLNEAGRALAYWHVYLAERSQSHTELAADALESFLAAGQEVLERRAERAAAEVSDFAERFGLERRMTRARATLSAIWAEHVVSFGRSAERPVPVQSDSEVNDFLELAPPCADAPDRQLSRRSMTGDTGTFERIHVRCHDRKDGVEYFFQKMTAEASRD